MVNCAASSDTGSSFAESLRHWRRHRRVSQLELGLQANVSPRHISFLENGRARPSRDMIGLLAEVLRLPLRERNSLFMSAGYVPPYSGADLDGEEMAPVREAIARILDKHEPYPAIVMDRCWNILRSNQGANDLLANFMEEPAYAASEQNGLRLLFSSRGLQPSVINWEELAATLLWRVRGEALSAPADSAEAGLYYELAGFPSVPEHWQGLAAQLPSGPVITMQLRRGSLWASLFTVLSAFGTPQDVTAQELRIESYFPADERTRELLESQHRDAREVG